MDRKQKRNSLCEKYKLSNKEANKFYKIASSILSSKEKSTKVYFEIYLLNNILGSNLIDINSNGLYILTNTGKIEAEEFFSI